MGYSAVLEYYSTLKCKAENGYGCEYQGYCVFCHDLAFT